jgi:hypothetical protein
MAAKRLPVRSGRTAWLLVGTTWRRRLPARPEIQHGNLHKVANFPLSGTMRVEGIRQSDRVTLRLEVEASWPGSDGVALKKTAQSMQVSRNGGVIRLQEKLLPGQDITMRRMLEGDGEKTVRARIVAEIDREAEGFLYAISILEPHVDFWEVDFPPLRDGEESLARLMMECSFCQRREVVYLNEMELKSFEIRRCVARVCKHCDAPSIWIEVQGDAKLEEALPSRTAVEERVIPRRNRTRVKARVLACIRQRGFQEEVVVCEDLSKGGVSFRSRNQYPQGSRIEVAVPYTPGSGAIFVPIRIVSSQPIRSAGLFRHGAAYLRVAD